MHRLQQICDAARDANRKVVVTGRSMITNTRIARELGYLDIDEEDLIDAFEIDKFPYNRVVVLCTGSQGEPLSALARMAAGEHRTLQIQEGDTVIISATPVPGNEKAVTDIINQLAKIGADVYDKSRCLVHVSGHGSEEELKLMMAFTKPTYIMPVHGEATHLRAHARIAQRMGIPESNIFVIENGNTLEMRSGVVALGEPVESGVVYVDGLRIGDTNRDVLLERKKLSEDGVILAVVRIHKKTGEVEEVSLMGRGVSFNASDSDFCEEATQRVKKSFSKHKATTLDHEERTKLAREVLTGYLWEAHHTRPMIMTHVMEA